MHWRIQGLILVLFLAAVMMGFLRFNRDRINQNFPAAQVEVSPSPESEVLTESPEIHNFATLLAVPFDLSQPASHSAMLDFINVNRPGMVILFGENISQEDAAATIQEIKGQITNGRAPIIAVDHEGGSVQRLSGEGFLNLPSWKRMCDQTQELRQAALASSAAQLASVGVDVVLAPMVDVAESNPALRDRVCDGDVEVVSSAAEDYVVAFTDVGINPVLKHYPGIGSVGTDLHQRFTTVEITTKDVEPFKNVLDSYPKIGVMTSHVGVENQITGVPCSQSFPCVKQIFELYPSVFVISDAIEMSAATYNPANERMPKSLAAATIDAILAGNHLVSFGPSVTADDLNNLLDILKTKYTSSEEFRIRVDEAATRINQIERSPQITGE